MRYTLIAMALLAALITPTQARPLGPGIQLEASAAVVSPSESWTYTAHVSRSMVVRDRLDTRIEPVAMSAGCSWDGVLTVTCHAEPAEPITITVHIRRNPCEPTLCRSMDWSIINQMVARGAESETVTVDVRESRAWPARRPVTVLWFPFATAGRSPAT